MSDISIKYKGNLRATATHLKSGSIISTDAPVDNNGKGEKFSPTDLFATALGSCMLTIMGLTAKTHGFSIDGSNIDIDKVMGKNPRRVSSIKILISLKGKFSDKEKQLLMKAAHHCPVSKSIHPEINEEIVFNFI
jgi:uncharacterized OsmC-like protein